MSVPETQIKFHRKKIKTEILWSGLFLIFAFLSFDSNAQGDLLITPRRVVFEGAKRTQELNLANLGRDTARYNVSVVQYRMLEDGNVEEITAPDPGQNFADKYLRFFPRSVTLGPGEAQVVKMQLMRTEQLSPGEYRSHIFFRAVPREALGEKKPAADSTSIAINIVPIFGITVPAIIRIGQSDMKVNFTDSKLELRNDTAWLNFSFNRTGNMSVYGDIQINWVPPQGKAIPVGKVEGVAVYTPNTKRNVLMVLDKKPEVDYHKGVLRMTYSSQSDTRPEKYAETELILK